MAGNELVERTVIIVDDDDVFRDQLSRLFKRAGADVIEAQALSTLLTRLAENTAIDFAVVDLRLGDDSGLEAVSAISAHSPKAAIVVLTGFGTIRNAVDAIRRGARDCLTKPAAFSAIVAALTGATSPEGGSREVPSLDQVEWEHLQRVMKETGGNISAAARMLGLQRRSLQRKLQKTPPLV